MFNILPTANYSTYTCASQHMVSHIYSSKIEPVSDNKSVKQILYIFKIKEINFRRYPYEKIEKFESSLFFQLLN